jgi:hypothetical protein
MFNGAPDHFGIVVGDVEETIARYKDLLGIGPWAVIDVDSDSEYWGRPARSCQKVAFAPWGPAYLEFIQPLAGDVSPAADFLRERGEGLFHIGYFHDGPTDDILPHKAVVRRNVRDGEVLSMWFDTLRDLGVYVEIVVPHTMEEILRSIRD